MPEPQHRNASLPAAKLPWHHTLVGKVVMFMLMGVLFAYLTGALSGFFMVERGAREQWLREAQVNAQIVSATIRRIYTSVAVKTDGTGQVTQIISERPIGDEESVLETGFSPVDVLALASAQTRNNVWLLTKSSDGSLDVVADALNPPSDPTASLTVSSWENSEEADDFYVGFAQVGDAEHFISSLPIVTADGQLLGVLVATIGQKEGLYQMRNDLISKAFMALLVVLIATALLVTILMRQLFTPVPVLIRSLTDIAKNQTASSTPYTDRNDEIGRMAKAIDGLRKKVIEREHLLEVKDEALRFQHLAHHDELTKLPNRVQLNNALKTAVHSLLQGDVFNVLLFDLDHFKAVNDSLGHAAGDALLVEVSQRVQGLLTHNDLVARLGGDEFAIIQRVVGSATNEAKVLAEAIVSTLREPYQFNSQEINIGVSVGIATAPVDGRNSHDLLRHADLALYAAKAKGRDRYMHYAAGMTMDSGIIEKR
ncbi:MULTISPECIES: GGDEF domain-containing protein [unclassified Halomonas]|uniref:GGDEF domain-containing protein n=1 Tax=unclassified Halomonas TaxID=2609666 RepID=UPI0007D92D36|nr:MULTISPECIES: GGDEF domain-containing protein [unclassified Halomonas]MBT2786166.1 diguanylate cyclase [Halomonas sp. ISL-106]MBT2797188.1 diguanylate cyclase [Halomonas sp. ISL-104]OAL58566.1 diguanylate cyclase [Halomonas sp. ALS9]